MRLLRVPIAVLLTVSLPGVALAQFPVPSQNLAGPADSELSEDEKMEKAKGLYVEAERLAADGNWDAAVILYEQAYYLVPGKHGFAHKVGIAAWNVKDCDKAFQYLSHFLEYADPQKQGDKIGEAKKMLEDIEAANCRTPEPEPEPEKPVEPVKPVETENPFENQDTNADTGKGKKDKKGGGKGLLAGGAVLITLGAGGIAVGAVGASMASSAGGALDDLSSTSTSTGYPVGDYACRNPADQCPTTLEGKLGTGKALTFAGFIGGGVLLVTGVALIVVHVKKGKSTPKASANTKRGVQLTGLGPTLLPGGGGAAASLRF